MNKYLLGIDVGTTGTKSLLFSENGELIGHAYQGYPLITPKTGQNEQNPEDWWNAIVKTVREVCSDSEIAKNVAAISLSTQGGTVVPVDDKCNALRPAIVWNDVRCQEQQEAFLKEVGGDDAMYKKTGWHLTNKLPAMVIRWIKENEPEIFNQTKMFLTVPDYISFKMTGIAAVDISNAGINQLCDITKKAYDKELLAFAGVGEEKLAKILSSGELIGNLTSSAALELGLSTDAVLISGAHDQYAVALGAGAINSGDILIGSGTAWVVTSISDSSDFDSGLSQSVSASKDMWGALQSLSTGGVCLDWLRKNISNEGEMPYDLIDKEVSIRKAAEEGLFFYPFKGKSTQDKFFERATFVGLDLSHDRFHMARAVMEGVVFQILWMMESFKAKPSKDGITLAGGASKSKAWSQLLADISGLPVRIPAVADLACVGAAIMAGVGSGLYPSIKDGYRKLSIKEHILTPDLEKTKTFSPLLAEYKHRAELLK